MNKKIIIPLVIISLGILTIFLFVSTAKKKQESVLQPSKAQVYYPLDSHEIVKDFYMKYQNCMKTPPSEANGNVSGYCQTHTGLTTVSFSQNLATEGAANAGVDPVTCSKDSPQSLTYDPNVINDETIVHVLVISKQGSEEQPIDVQLAEEGRSWKINTIVCQSL